MVCIELEVDGAEAEALRREAATFGFEDTGSYVRWLVTHRAVTFDGPTGERRRTEELSRRVETLAAEVAELRADSEAGETGKEGERTDARGGIDWMLLQTESADDETVAAAIPPVEEAVDEEMDL
jgi:hypothetical protein